MISFDSDEKPTQQKRAAENFPAKRINNFSSQILRKLVSHWTLCDVSDSSRNKANCAAVSRTLKFIVQLILENLYEPGSSLVGKLGYFCSIFILMIVILTFIVGCISREKVTRYVRVRYVRGMRVFLCGKWDIA